MSRPADWSPIGRTHDPIPGDPDTVSLIGREYVGTADSIQRAAANLEHALSSGFGQSEAIDAIREEAARVARRIQRAEERYRRTGEAMISYAPVLADTQSRSLDALNAAIGAQNDRDFAEAQAARVRRSLEDPNTPPANIPALEEDLSRWTLAAGRAGLSLAGAEDDLRDAIVDRDLQAESALELIDDLEDSGGLKDSWWEGNVVNFIQEHKEAIDLFVDIVGWVATAVMVVALFIPGLNVLVGIVAAIAAIVMVANATLQFLSGTMNLGEALLNVGLAALTFVGGKMISSALKATETGIKQAAATAIRSSYAGSGLRGMTQARALAKVEAVASASTRGGLSVLERLHYIALDYKSAAIIRNLAGMEMLSGSPAASLAPYVMRMQQVALQGIQLEVAAQAIGATSETIGDLLPPSGWRLGGDW